MHVYTVRKTIPNTDREFEAYVDLLQEIGIDITNVPRVPEPGTENRWLYAWNSKPEAERFARELCSRLRQSDWRVHDFEIDEESVGPLAPLTIRSISTTAGTDFLLDSASLSRILSHFPNARPTGEVSFSSQVRADHERQHGPVWNQVIRILTGIPDEAIARLGGVRVVADDDGSELYSDVSADVPQTA